jgi:hypothetical protein
MGTENPRGDGGYSRPRRNNLVMFNLFLRGRLPEQGLDEAAAAGELHRAAGGCGQRLFQ